MVQQRIKYFAQVPSEALDSHSSRYAHRLNSPWNMETKWVFVLRIRMTKLKMNLPAGNIDDEFCIEIEESTKHILKSVYSFQTITSL